MAIKELADFDFGFSAVSEEELKTIERELEATVASKDQQIKQVEQTYHEKLGTLYNMIMPLLKNLAKDEGKDYIYWPGRKEKMEAFIRKVQDVVNDDS
jgi:flavin-dependent dehydrogenase